MGSPEFNIVDVQAFGVKRSDCVIALVTFIIQIAVGQ